VTASTDIRTGGPAASESDPESGRHAKADLGAPDLHSSASDASDTGIPVSGAPGLDAAVFRSIFRRHAAGVAVITAAGPEGPVGFTATSLTSVAAEPPLLSFGISLGASTWPAVAEAPFVGVHILGDHQEALASVFARSGADRFAPPTAWSAGPHGVPLLDGVSAWVIARVLSRVPAGDHRLVVAQAVAGDPHGPGTPLLYHEGTFHRLPR
jgi:flavin reductase (DIM6/NTAB) family NADH-FMN oxidoreductase RutF